jgi:hypothetical protein
LSTQFLEYSEGKKRKEEYGGRLNVRKNQPRSQGDGEVTNALADATT